MAKALEDISDSLKKQDAQSTADLLKGIEDELNKINDSQQSIIEKIKALRKNPIMSHRDNKQEI